MPTLGLETAIVDRSVYDNTVARFRQAQIRLPTFAELAEPRLIDPGIAAGLAAVPRDEPVPRNLYRIHWYNAADSARLAAVPDHLVLPSELTGVEAKIVVLLADLFPMIHAHKVLATYGCLVPRIVTGQFDPTRHKAVWPSTGNYCRGGVAVSRILGCRGVAVLPEGMSRERFEWLESWVADPADIVRTPGTESNVKEIYDRCAELERDPENIVFNQFSEFGNHLAHYLATGRALEDVFEHLRETETDSGLELAGYVSATGSAGTLAAGDYLKERHGSKIVAVEALECPTLLYNGFGEHNIQGIGDKHVPLIHNAMNTDFVAAVSDRATDALFVLFGSDAGREHLANRRGVDRTVVSRLARLGFSGIANVLAAIKLAKYLDLGPDQAVLTIATDGAELYASETEKILERDHSLGFDAVAAAETCGEHLLGVATDHLLELDHRDRERIFNLGYFTWVEQQGIALEDFNARKKRGFWRGLRDLVPVWDGLIAEMNARVGAHDA